MHYPFLFPYCDKMSMLLLINKVHEKCSHPECVYKKNVEFNFTALKKKHLFYQTDCRQNLKRRVYYNQLMHTQCSNGENLQGLHSFRSI